MSLYVLDTDCLTLFLHGHAEICAKAAGLDPADLAITIVTGEETLTGWYSQIRRAKRDDQNLRTYAALQEAVGFCGSVRIIPFDEKALDCFKELRTSNRKIGANDLKIAAIVLVNNAILITRNSRDFRGLPTLQVENWS